MSKLHHDIAVVTVLGCLALSSACLDRELKPLNPCLVSSVSRKVSVNNIDKIDMLFMVDNSNSMSEEQAALKQQFPKLVQVLTTGMRMPNDPNPFPAAKDLHLGVVSSDMGAFGQVNVPGCDANGGGDGRLQSLSRGAAGCSASYPSFLKYVASADPNGPTQIASDFGCIAELGTGGCGFEQQLESPFKALWPSVYSDAQGNVAPSPYNFLGAVRTGRGDLAAPEGALGFIRTDVSLGLSLIAIVLVTDEDDCSSSDTGLFHVATSQTDPLFDQGTQTRCFYNKTSQYPVTRYIDGFKQLRPGYEKLVVFAAITGVPPDLVTDKARAAVDFTDDAKRDAYYDGILNNALMQERVVGRGQNSQLATSCMRRDRTGQVSTAFPPRRIVQVAKGFGENGVVQSICQDDFGPAMDAIIEVIARQLGAVCLPRPLVRRSDGLVGCNVIWELPPVDKAPVGAPTECGAMPFLKPVDDGTSALNDRQGANCKVDQLPVKTAGTVPSGAGWYYDNFSQGVMSECPGVQRQRVSFTNGAKPSTGVIVTLQCLNETQRLPDTRDISTKTPQPEIGSPCSDVKQGTKTVSGDSACVVSLNDGSTDKSMFCHPELNVCVKTCQSANDCPGAWECDDRPETLAAAKKAFCVNPTCGTD
jgi:hypothetical protein